MRCSFIRKTATGTGGGSSTITAHSRRTSKLWKWFPRRQGPGGSSPRHEAEGVHAQQIQGACQLAQAPRGRLAKTSEKRTAYHVPDTQKTTEKAPETLEIITSWSNDMPVGLNVGQEYRQVLKDLVKLWLDTARWCNVVSQHVTAVIDGKESGSLLEARVLASTKIELGASITVRRHSLAEKFFSWHFASGHGDAVWMEMSLENTQTKVQHDICMHRRAIDYFLQSISAV